MPQSITLTPGTLSIETLRTVYEQPVTIKLPPDCHQAINNSVQVVADVIASNETVYGINTGFGLLANTRIPHDQLEILQNRLVLSHAAGTGELLDEKLVRLIMVLKLNSLARGYSGIRLEVLEIMAALINHGIHPCIPSQGSVGASGDLAPLAHMSMALLGEGNVHHLGVTKPARDALTSVSLSPVKLAPKEGLALLNGTQVSTALALQALFEAEDLFKAALLTGSLSLEATLGSRKPFDSRIHAVRGQQGQIDTAEIYRYILEPETEISRSHQPCSKVQDPYSLRCQPQVMGACLTQLRHCCNILLTEANAVSDNPLVLYEQGDILSGGNFHAEPVAMAADNMALAIAEIGALSERRMALLMDSQLSGLPAFLVKNGGINSGFMIAQVTAAALASENKMLAHPACVDSLPTSANQEDHVSMATHAARRLQAMNNNTRGIVAIELLAGCQGIDFRKPLKTSNILEQAYKAVRRVVAFYDKDRFFAPDIETAQQLLISDPLITLIPKELL
ncbi:histidine ammonia-lyase [Endozoicomonas montiporae]|uniref:Histidine ammonia-lyase n=2 Tax=Endozoicomonas montiporae TaxID=1027273 RepID=A0A081N7F2_9GAMM|nr:histidine ammonia-lyase [Endozoicomonas montiporae]AMO55783.1 histidine ammonia-lyase [Endozoicomonas montiporae CL-33]KEQ14375.1 histidine ammonia-lyase [Endozoicomonas montiporae]